MSDPLIVGVFTVVVGATVLIGFAWAFTSEWLYCRQIKREEQAERWPAPLWVQPTDDRHYWGASADRSKRTTNAEWKQ